MKEMMFEFLDDFYPDVFLYRTKFGVIPKYNISGDYAINDVKRKHIKMLSNFFSCHYDVSWEVYEEWLNRKPIYVRIKNSTNNDTFVLESQVNHHTT